MSNMGWEKAVEVVLKKVSEPMHYKEIAEEIAARELRKNLGATPANTVNMVINKSLREKEDSPFLKLGRGLYSLRDFSKNNEEINSSSGNSERDDELAPSGLLQSLGMYWRASEVAWKSRPRILGQQQIGSDSIDFYDQLGVYLLHDRGRVVYVGRSLERPMGQRLYEHTKDRLNGRWDRFSWFGLKSVGEEGELCDVLIPETNEKVLIATLEALLIEALEPPQNRKRGDQFSAVEYLQVPDPEKNQQKIDAITALIKGELM